MDATLAVMLLVMFGLLAIPVIGYSLKVRDAVRIGRFLRLVACYGMVGIFGFIGTVMVLSTIDRGTVLQAVALAVLWLVPPLGVALWSRRGARGLEPVLWTVLGLVCAAAAAAALSAAAWMDVANDQGPYFQVIVLVTGVCLAIWSVREPVHGGIAMIVLGLAPLLILALAPGADGAFMARSISPVVAFAGAGAACLVGVLLGSAHRRPGAAVPVS